MTSAAADPSLIDSPTAAWRLLTTLGLVTLGNSGMYVVSVVLPAVQTEFGVSRAAASMPYTLMMVGLGLGGIFTGRLADRHARRLHFIRRARDLGFPLDKVRELLLLSDQEQRPCAQADVIAREHLDEVERKIAELQEMRRELGAIIDGCCQRVVADCAVIGALRTEEVQQ